MAVVIAGGGDIAFSLASTLAGAEDVFVILPEAASRQRFEHLDLQTLVGPAVSRKTLRQTRLSDDDTFIACTGADELNIIACLAARNRSRARTCCFVSRDEHFESFRDPEQTPLPGVIDHLIWPQRSLALEISRIVREPHALDVETFHKGRVWLMEYRLPPDSPLCGLTLARAPLPEGALVVSRVRDGRLVVPGGKDRLEADDKVLFMGQRPRLLEVARDFFAASESEVMSVTIVGGGQTGRLLARDLTSRLQPEVKIIEISPVRSLEIADEVPRATVFQGDGTDLRLLEETGADRSDALVALAGNDQTNLFCSLIAKQLGIPKVVTGASNEATDKMFERVGIDVSLNASAISTAELLLQIQAPSLEFRATLEDGLAEVVEVKLPDDFEPKALRDLDLPRGIIVGAIVRLVTTIVPGGPTVVRPGDRLLIVATVEAAEAVGGAFGLATTAGRQRRRN